MNHSQSSSSTSSLPNPKLGRRLIVRVALGLLCGLVIVVLAGAWWVNSQLSGSLATLDGEVALAGLSADVTVERDVHGVPTLRGANRIDVARGLGYVHAQERYFQMDLIRRQAAGELSELVGSAAIDADKRLRLHRFRHRAKGIVEDMSSRDRALLMAYTEGVNAGRMDLSSAPFEYLILDVEAAPWRPEDSILVVFAMYLDLQGRSAQREASFGTLQRTQPELFDFLVPKGDHWDAPIVGEAWTPAAIPGPEIADLRQTPKGPDMAPDATVEPDVEAPQAVDSEEAAADVAWFGPGNDPFDAALDTLPGSNNWAVDGAHSAHGGALLANDMHLGHSVPNIWFRAALVYPDPVSGEERRMVGVSLPGTPAVVAGSNGHVAWGFTNSYGDWSDLVVLDAAEGDPTAYATPDGPRTLEVHREILRVKGEDDIPLDIQESIWGPVVDEDWHGQRLAQRWTAHLRGAVNLGLVEMEGARDLETAMQMAHRSGVPAQNFAVVDADGRIGWTIIGPFPRRFGHDGSLPSSWADGSRGWDGLLTSGEVPRVVDPETGRVWTANSRVVGGEMYELLQDGGYDRGARAGRIRDGLMALDQASEADLLAIQLDDRALFLEPWRALLQQVLESSSQPRHQELLAALDDWTGHASPQSVAYRVVREFRGELRHQVFAVLTAPSKAADEDFDYRHLGREEAALWQLATERPQHLLDPRFESWDGQFMDAADRVFDKATAEGLTLATFTWGSRNRVHVRHPLSRFMPSVVARRLDMAPVEVPGDRDMPRVQGPSFGASERLVVSPGREDEGFFHMPSGQSGHPKSPFYRAGFEAWATGQATPFLPGPPVYELILRASP